MKVVKWIAVCAVTVLAAGSVSAQDPVPSLRDLEGIDKGTGGYQMQKRGYKYIKTDTAGDQAWDYWQQTENGSCVVVHVSDNRFASIVTAMYESCSGGDSGSAHSGGDYGSEDKFESVCGVIVNGQNYRYKCRVVNFYDGGQIVKTALHYPDQNIRLVWKDGNNVVLHFEGMTPQHATYSSSEGETDFYFEDKTYFYISDKSRAEMEVRDLRN